MAGAGYRPFEWLERDAEFRRVVTGIRGGHSIRMPLAFDDIYRELTEWGDPYFRQADFRSRADAHQRAVDVYREWMTWARLAAVNVARMKPFLQ